MAKAPGIGGWDALSTYPQAMQETLKKQYNEKYSAEDQKRPTKPDIVYKQPQDFDEYLEHHTNFFEKLSQRQTGSGRCHLWLQRGRAMPCLQ